MTMINAEVKTDAGSGQGRQSANVMFVGPSLAGGGAEKRFRNLCRALTQFQTDICVLTGNVSIQEADIGKKVISLGWRSEFSYPHMILKLHRMLHKGNYDAVIGFGLFPSAVSWLSLRLLRQRPKFVVIEITRPWTASALNVWYRKWLYRRLYSAVYHAADLVTANSADGIEECRRYFHLSNTKTIVLPNLIDTEEISSRAEGGYEGPVSEEKKLIVAMSRLIKMKRFDTLIEAAAMLSNDRSWAVMIIGDGTERANLEALARARDLSDRVRFAGWVENPFPFLKRASAFVLCSEYEGFSNSLLEAMFLGVPVVTSFCSSDVRLMCGQGAAKGFEPGDATALASHLSEVLNSPEEGEKMRKAAFAYCGPHDMKKGVQVYEQAILEVIGCDPASGKKGGQ